MSSCGGGCIGNNNYPNNLSEDIIAKTESHPCYSSGAHDNARMHIPVAPKCNIQCNYCNRKYDCVNETRPGVTSEVLTPGKAMEKFKYVKTKVDNLKVVGIAGPGDALANWEEAKKSIELIQKSDPEVTICLSTNGLMLDKYKEEIVKLGIHHVTVTMNSIDPKIGAQIYEFIRYEGKNYTGVEGAKILQENQFKGIKYLSENGVLCKVNIVMIKGINDEHIPEVVKKAKELGAFMTNIMPLIPAEGTVFENQELVSKKELDEIRNRCSVNLKQMFHCQQCRADAIGKLSKDESIKFRDFSKKGKEKIIFAVASSSGEIIDQHFGHATNLYVYSYEKERVSFMEKRIIQKYCEGKQDCTTKESKTEKML
ncbi:MAG: nitrogenase cofactor biosynthesis protein NifB, partial [Fusobacteriota bacterium]